MGERPYTVHLHNTRGTGLANAAAAIEAGARIFDASLAGLGGCPFAPGATGNVVIEDLLFMFEKMGYSTGVDISKLVQARAVIEESMPEEPLYGGIARAGLPKNFG
jgi:hydroxymethylglutaryl-CoA lyase